ncbi:hypothetical protein [Nocardia sp. NPDC049149]|uniref:hypothetical protein n=1 Tax=Nocardia sp. NPDC049149 TaxID=3364315 RepID=UPI003723E382
MSDSPIHRANAEPAWVPSRLSTAKSAARTFATASAEAAAPTSTISFCTKASRSASVICSASAARGAGSP